MAIKGTPLENCSACEDLKQYAPDFVVNGVTDEICASLGKDTGLNPNLSPKHNNCEDLQDLNDCLFGSLGDTLPSLDICEVIDYLEKLMKNLYEMFNALICNECGQWKEIWELWRRVKRLESAVYTDVDGKDYHWAMEWHLIGLTEDDFIQLAPGVGRDVWFSGNITDENVITVTLRDLDIADHYIPVPLVAGGRANPVTVAWQDMVQLGNRVRFNFDLYQIMGTDLPDQGVPFPLNIWVIVFGKKKVADL